MYTAIYNPFVIGKLCFAHYMRKLDISVSFAGIQLINCRNHVLEFKKNTLCLKNESENHRQNLVQVLNQMKYEIAQIANASGDFRACCFCLCEWSSVSAFGASDFMSLPPNTQSSSHAVSLWDMQSSGKTHGWYAFPVCAVTVTPHVFSEFYHIHDQVIEAVSGCRHLSIPLLSHTSGQPAGNPSPQRVRGAVLLHHHLSDIATTNMMSPSFVCLFQNCRRDYLGMVKIEWLNVKGLQKIIKLQILTKVHQSK